MWERATTIAGVNAELWPLARMTGEGEIREGALGRSWILAGGVLPIDYDDICLEARRARPRLPRALAARLVLAPGTTTAR